MRSWTPFGQLIRSWLRREVKNLVIEKKLNSWSEVLEKANSDYDGNRKEFWVEGRRVESEQSQP